MKVIFICGPFGATNSWVLEQNVRNAEALSFEVWRAGAAAICPHASSRYFLGSLPEEMFVAGYKEILKRCDAVLLVLNWEMSKGSVGEVEEAKRIGIPIFDSIYKLKVWLTGGID